ncbi:hypothetical protein AKJ16_DCAP14624 [Drosera capensis]
MHGNIGKVHLQRSSKDFAHFQSSEGANSILEWSPTCHEDFDQLKAYLRNPSTDKSPERSKALLIFNLLGGDSLEYDEWVGDANLSFDGSGACLLSSAIILQGLLILVRSSSEVVRRILKVSLMKQWSISEDMLMKS